jgi:uncharacterized protein with PIN domain
MYDCFPMYRRVQYKGGATFIPVCPKCNRFVKADKSVKVNGLDEIKEDEANATCSKCGRVAMPFEGYY